MPAPVDRTGIRYGSLVALVVEGSSGGKRVWRCQCDCGNTRAVIGTELGRLVTSCGCKNRTAHFAANPRKTHGMKDTPEYRAWNSMKQRCMNPRHKAFHNYGARGIRVALRWMRFETFLDDIGMRPSADMELDRINNDGPYAPGNVRWTTRSENLKNTRPRLRTKSGQWAEGGVARNLNERCRGNIGPEAPIAFPVRATA